MNIVSKGTVIPSNFSVAKPASRQGTASRVRVIRCNAVASDDVLDVVIVGGGLSGLCTGQGLASRHAGKTFVITEARDRVGGNITTVEGDVEGKHYLWEEGPNSFQPNDSMLQIAVEAGIDKDLVLGDPTAPRFVYWENKLRATPSGPDALTFDLLSIWGKIRAGLGAVGLYKSGPMPSYEESVEQFIRRNLGDEVFYRLIEPFCSGVYAGDPSKLSMKAAFGRIHTLEEQGGSLVGGAIKLFQDRKANPPPPRDPRLPPKPKGQTVGSFRKGLQMLPQALEAKLKDKIKTGWKLEAVSKKSDGTFELKYSTPKGSQTLRAKKVAMTAPAYVVADLIKESAPKAANALASFDYPPVAAVTVAYPKSAVRDDRKDGSGNVPGFGQLHPRTQGIVTLGTIYSSTLFPGRAPEEMMLLLCYIGGATNRGIKDQPEDEVVAQIDKDLRKMLIKDDAPKAIKVGMRVWPRAIPQFKLGRLGTQAPLNHTQFNLGHLDALEEARASLKEAGLDGVLLGGNYVSGVALGKVVEFGFGEFADSIAESLGKDQGRAAGALN